MYSAEQSGWGHSPTHAPGAASQWVKARNWCGPQRAFARGHGLEALTTRTRGACPLTGRDRDVGRTNQIETSLKEVSGLKAGRSSAQSVSQGGPCAASRASILPTSLECHETTEFQNESTLSIPAPARTGWRKSIFAMNSPDEFAIECKQPKAYDNWQKHDAKHMRNVIVSHVSTVWLKQEHK